MNRGDAQVAPAEVAAKLSPAKREYVETKVVLPAWRAAVEARRVAEQERRVSEARERDPR